MKQIILVILGFISANAYARVETVRKFNGGNQIARNGGFYVDISLNPTKSFHFSKRSTKQIQVDLYQSSQQKFYTFKHSFQTNQNVADQVWLLPPGSYRIVRISFMDSKGISRQWFSKQIKSFTVQPKTISNLGTWTLSRKGKKFIRSKFESAPNIFDLYARKNYAFNTVINGFSNAVQTKADPTNAGQDIVTYDRGSNEPTYSGNRVSQSVQMTYNVNLFRDQAFASRVINVLRTHDQSLRRCYATELSERPSLKGVVVISFTLPTESQIFSNLKIVRSTLANSSAQSCLNDELSHIYVDIDKPMLGVLSFNFNVFYSKI